MHNPGIVIRALKFLSVLMPETVPHTPPLDLRSFIYNQGDHIPLFRTIHSAYLLITAGTLYLYECTAVPLLRTGAAIIVPVAALWG